MERRRFETRHGRKLLLGGAREVTAAPGAAGLPTAWKRNDISGVDRAGAIARRCAARGCWQLQRPPPRRVVPRRGSRCCGSTPARVPTAASYVQADGARQGGKGLAPFPLRSRPHILDPTLGSGPRGGRYFIYRPPPDGSRSTVHLGGLDRAALRRRLGSVVD